MEAVTTPEELRIPEDAVPSSAQDDVALLRRFARSLEERSRTMIGFPVDLDFDYRPMAGFLALHLNNVGDPDQVSEYALDTKPFERAVIDFFIDMAGGDREQIFGYVGHGGTESNLFAAYVGRERYPDAVLYSSADAHYSVPKAARLLRVEHVPIATAADGEMDLEVLRREFRHRPGKPALVVATIGTTGRGAVDDVPGIRTVAEEEGVGEVFVHSDAAFGGPLAAYGEPARPWAYRAGADSVSISGHKMIGSPVPSSVVLVRRADIAAIRQPDAAVGSDDDTISGSRNALAPLFLWYALRRLGRTGFAQRVHQCLELTDYAVRCLRSAGRNPSRAPGGNVVLFDPPSADVMRQWRLLEVDDRAHLTVMPHVTEEHIDRLCESLT